MKIPDPKTVLPFVCGASLTGLLAWGLLWPVEEEVSLPPQADSQEIIELDVDFVGRDAGIQRWRLLAEEMRLQGDLQLFEQGARGWFYGAPTEADGVENDAVFFANPDEIQWQAELASYHSDLNRLDLEQNVRVFDDSGTLLETETLHVYPNRTLDSESPFMLQSPTVILTGQSGTFDFRLSELTAVRGQALIAADTSEPSTVLDAASPDPNTITITADQIDYDRDIDVVRAEGNLVIAQGETTVTAPRGIYQRRESASLLEDGVTLVEPDRILTSERMTGDHQEKIYTFERGVVFVQQETVDRETDDEDSAIVEVQQAPTEVRADRMIYRSQTEIATFFEAVELTQEGRQARSAEATVEPNMIILRGNVQLDQTSGEWLAQRSDDAEVQEAVNRPTRIYAERVEIDRQSNDVRFYDRVAIIQANRSAEGDEGVYRESTQMLELVGTSTPAQLCERPENTLTDEAPSLASLDELGLEALEVTCRGADWISSPLIVFDMERNTLSTQGPSQFQFRLDEEELPQEEGG